MSIRRHAWLLGLVGGIMILLLRVQAQVRPQDEHPAGMDVQFTTQIDDAHAYAAAHWTSTLNVTLDYNLNSPHAAPVLDRVAGATREQYRMAKNVLPPR